MSENFFERMAKGKGTGSSAGSTFSEAWDHGNRISQEIRALMLKRVEEVYPEETARGSRDLAKAMAPMIALGVANAILGRWIGEAVQKSTEGDKDHPVAKVMELIAASFRGEDIATMIANMHRVVRDDEA